MEKIRVLIVDDHPLFRQGVRHTLEATKDIEVIGEAPDGQRAIQMAEALAPDLMLIDIKLARPERPGSYASSKAKTAADRGNNSDRLRGRRAIIQCHQGRVGGVLLERYFARQAA